MTATPAFFFAAPFNVTSPRYAGYPTALKFLKMRLSSISDSLPTSSPFLKHSITYINPGILMASRSAWEKDLISRTTSWSLQVCAMIC